MYVGYCSIFKDNTSYRRLCISVQVHNCKIRWHGHVIYLELNVASLYIWNAQTLTCARNAHTYALHIACNVLLSSTQAEAASRDAKIRLLEERCEQLVPQVSPALDIVLWTCAHCKVVYVLCAYNGH